MTKAAFLPRSYECKLDCAFDTRRLWCYVQYQTNLGNLVIKMGTASRHAVYRSYAETIRCCR